MYLNKSPYNVVRLQRDYKQKSCVPKKRKKRDYKHVSKTWDFARRLREGPEQFPRSY